MTDERFLLTPLYENAVTIVRGGQGTIAAPSYLLTAWTRSYFFAPLPAGRSDSDSPLVILYAGIRESENSREASRFAEVFWKRTEWSEGHPDVVRVEDRNCALEKAVEHGQSWPHLVWDELGAFPRGVTEGPRLLWSPDDAPKKRHDQIRAHLDAMANRPTIERHAAVCMIERVRPLAQRDGQGTIEALTLEARREILCVWNRRYHCWLMPGGRVEASDVPKGAAGDGAGYRVAAARELYEETGMAGDVGDEVYSASLVPRPEHEDRASVVHIFRASIGALSQGAVPHEREPGCPVTWMTRTEFLRGCAFADFYVEAFAAIDRKDKLAAEGAS